MQFRGWISLANPLNTPNPIFPVCRRYLMTETLTHFIGGKQISAPGALESLNPSNTGEVIAKFPDGSPEDVNKALEAARAAFPGWAGASPEVRADLLDKIGSLILERKDV